MKEQNQRTANHYYITVEGYTFYEITNQQKEQIDVFLNMIGRHYGLYLDINISPEKTGLPKFDTGEVADCSIVNKED